MKLLFPCCHQVLLSVPGAGSTLELSCAAQALCALLLVPLEVLCGARCWETNGFESHEEFSARREFKCSWRVFSVQLHSRAMFSSLMKSG